MRGACCVILCLLRKKNSHEKHIWKYYRDNTAAYGDAGVCVLL